MNNHHEQRQAEQFDALLSALQAGQPPPPTPDLDAEDVRLARAVVARVQEAEPPRRFDQGLQRRLDTGHDGPRRRQRIVTGLAGLGALAASFLVVVAVAFLFSDDNAQQGDPARQANATRHAETVAAFENPSATPAPVTRMASTGTPLASTPTPIEVAATQPALEALTPEMSNLDPSATPRPSQPPSAEPTATLTVSPAGTDAAAIPGSTLTAPAVNSATPQGTATPQAHGTSAPRSTFDPAAQMTAPPSSATAPPVDLSDFQSQLQAGEVNDNTAFDAYLQYRMGYQRYRGTAHVLDVDISHRHAIVVTTPDGLPVLGAEVWIYAPDGTQVTQLQTPASGVAYFFPRAYPGFADAPYFAVVVRRDQAVARFTLTREATDMTWPVALDVVPTRPPVQLDVLFLVDSTGSMSDEIRELKLNMLSMSAQIDALPGQPDVRFAMVTYRDQGDAYVTRVVDFTPDVNAFQQELNALQASGGGDEPEALNQALNEALWAVEWRGGQTVKLIILVADAPPQLGYPNDTPYPASMRAAAARGITIHTIASSGLNYDGEYVFRQLAQFTGGHFIFLTYAETPQSPSSNEPGAPGTDLNVPEAAYTVEYLDALVVRLIAQELDALQGN